MQRVISKVVQNRVFLSVIVCGLFVGCGGGEKTLGIPPQVRLISELKAELETVAKHGEQGSALDPLKEKMEQLRQYYPAEVREWEKQVAVIVNAKTPEKRKELAEKLYEEIQDTASESLE